MMMKDATNAQGQTRQTRETTANAII